MDCESEAVQFAGESILPRRRARLTRITAGYGFICGLRPGGRPVCTGDNGWGESEAPGGPFTQVASGGYSGSDCGLRAGGTLTCWGLLGDAFPPPGVRPTPQPAGAFKQIALGLLGSVWACALHIDGRVSCWEYAGAANDPPPSGTFTQISTGGETACALATSGELDCWSEGLNVSAPPAGVFVQVSVGAGWDGDFACAIARSHHLTCWGDDHGYQGVEDGQIDPPPGKYSQVEAGTYLACGLKTDRSAVCWGDAGVTPLPGKYLALGGGVACGLLTDHHINCPFAQRPGSWQPWTAGTYTQLSVQADLCGVRMTGAVRCWTIGGEVDVGG